MHIFIYFVLLPSAALSQGLIKLYLLTHDWIMDFRNFFISYVVKVEETVSRRFTLRNYSKFLEILVQLPVSQVLEETDDWVLWIFVISSFPTFLRSWSGPDNERQRQRRTERPVLNPATFLREFYALYDIK